MKTINRIPNWLMLFALSLLVSSCSLQDSAYVIENNNLKISINDRMQTKISNGDEMVSNWSNSEYLILEDNTINDFHLKSSHQNNTTDDIGNATEYEFIGESVFEGHSIRKKMTIRTYQNYPDMAIFQLTYYNDTPKDLLISGWVNHDYSIEKNTQDSVFWSFQGSSTSARADWILPVQAGFSQQNYMGMNDSDYGGGIPVLDIWRSDVGLTIGHSSLTPELVSFPLEMEKSSEHAKLRLEKEYHEVYVLESGDSLNTIESFVMVHHGDCFKPLKQFSTYMQNKGIPFVDSEESAYEAVWCAWGYERAFTLDEIIGTLPKVKDLGFKWAVLDDGFQKAEGDWLVNKEKFPKGEQQMKDLVSTIHSYGLKAKLWWAPLAVDPCTPLLQSDKDILLLNEDSSPRFISWWDSWYMSPLSPKTKQHTTEVVNMFLKDWDFDGLKMDGQHMNAVPPDYNSIHNQDNAELAVKQLPEFFKDIYKTATQIKPHAVIENCPCGCCMSFYNMAYMNQAVSSDPLSSWQIRLKGKVYKALIGKTAYYGDHVELSDDGEDFASSFGIGAVLGSKFTWPKDNPQAEASYLLTPEKEKKWKKWIALYNNKMLSKEAYLGDLYDIGFDKPETHLIQKQDTLFYAFYADKWNGKLEFRGLETGKSYRVYDYINEKELGTIKANNPFINTSFSQYLLVEVSEDKGL